MYLTNKKGPAQKMSILFYLQLKTDYLRLIKCRSRGKTRADAV